MPYANVYHLEEFIQAIVGSEGAALRGTIPKPTPESVAEELKGVAHDVAVALFGDQTPLHVELDKHGAVRLFQVLRVVTKATDPQREIALSVLRDPGGEHANAKSGELIRVPIEYTFSSRYAVAERQEHFGAHVPLPLYSKALEQRLSDALNAALLRYFPAPPPEPGSLAELLATDGGWTRGITVQSGGYELTVTGAFWDFCRTGVTKGLVEYGFCSLLCRDGVELFRGGRDEGYASIVAGEAEVHLTSFRKTEPDHGLGVLPVLPTSAAAKPAFEAVLQRAVDELSVGRRPTVGLSELLTAAITPPVFGGLWDWTREALPKLVGAFRHETERDGEKLIYAVEQVHLPTAAAGAFGTSRVAIAVRSGDDDADEQERELPPIGGFSPAALTLRGPETEREVRDLEAIVSTFLAWLRFRIDQRCATFGFPLLQLLEQRMLWGPPGEVPVPSFEEDSQREAISRAGRMLEPVAKKRWPEILGDENPKHVVALFSVPGWFILLQDDIKGPPFGSSCGLLVRPDDGGWLPIMTSDPWDPESRRVIDGDAFAFTRFLTWLREAIVVGGHDRVLTFRKKTTIPCPLRRTAQLLLSDWLRLGHPDMHAGDRFLVDWRCQRGVVPAGQGIESFTPIHAFSPAFLERLRNHDIPTWRRFLEEVIDPRFARTTGALSAAPRGP